MFWVGVSLIVMSMTGLGDDTRVLLDFIRNLQVAAQEEMSSPEKSQEVVSALEDFRTAYFRHREELGEAGDCIDKLDRSYEVTVEEYLACADEGSKVMNDAAEVLIDTRHRIQGATTDDEIEAIRARMLD